jgi:membrane-anchored glycerophosphoryl diester phosphodiesterase (GDPDase)
MNRNRPIIVWFARVLIGLVAISNLYAAFSFLISPALYAPGFELSGTAGAAMIRGVGLLFLMWNIPYLVAVLNPLRYFVSLVEAVSMQAIGVAGESLILSAIPGEHLLIHSSVMRFIYFDAGGLVLLFVALGLMALLKKKTGDKESK